MKNHPHIIGILACDASAAAIIPISNLIYIMKPLVDKINLIRAVPESNSADLSVDKSRVSVYSVLHVKGCNSLSRVCNYISLQLKISLILIRLVSSVDVWFFFSGDGLLLPMLAAKLTGKKVVLIFGGSLEQEGAILQDKLYKILSIIKKLNCFLSDGIIVYSSRLIYLWNLTKYSSKIKIAPHHLLDSENFKMGKQITDRDNIVGYIGRLSEEKGILNFVKSIPVITKERNGVNFLIGGDGKLRGNIERYLNENDLNTKVKFVGWISHDNLPQYLSELKLIVLPSYTEGLPNIMLEAMACGTLVLATPVGAIPDYVKDGETGFIMENNSPECIANNIERVLNAPNLEQITNNGRALVEKEFRYEIVVECYRKILKNI